MIELTALDLVIFIGFAPALALICWMIYNKPKVIAFEDKIRRVLKAIFYTIKEEIFSKKSQKTS